MMGKKRAMLLGLDGADPVVIKRLMAEGRMPNLEKLLKEGTATESLSMMGVFPTVTPPNWTTLATGNWPKTHGITCFQNHTLGKSLNISEYNWDSRRIESELIWEAMEDEGKRCIMLNYCQAWPNRVKDSKNIFIDGTGMVPFLRSSADFQKYVYLDAAEEKLREIPHTVRNSSGDCVVYGDQAEKATKVGGDDLESVAAGHHFTAGEYVADTPMLEQETIVMYNNSVEEAANGDVIDKQYAPIKDAKNWSIEIPENAKEAVYVMNSGLDRRHILLTASNGKDYDTLSFHKNKKSEAWTNAKAGEWTDWIYDTFLLNDKPTSVAYKIRVVAIDPAGSTASFYLSHTMNLENDSYFYPRELGHEMFEALGPAMYFGTFFRHSDIGDQVVVETWQQNHQWQANAAKWLFNKYPDWQLFYIHLHSIDLMNHWYINQAIPGSHPDWQRHKAAIEKVYEINDAFIGEMMEYLDGDTTIFVVSDHAATPRSPGYKNPGNGTLGFQDQWIGKEDVHKAKKILADFGLKERIRYPYDTLSKGQQQKVLISRALMADPELMILDLPCGGLDIFAREYFLHMVEGLTKERNMGVIYVTHHTEEILPFFNKAALMKDGALTATGDLKKVFTKTCLSDFFEVPTDVLWTKNHFFINLNLNFEQNSFFL